MKHLLVVFLLSLGGQVFGQIGGQAGLFNLFGGSNTNQSNTGTGTAQTPNVVQQVPIEDEKPDSLKDKQNKVESSEADLRRLQIEKERIVLEREIEELKSQGLRTAQDTINLEVKQKNLYLLYLKEQLLLKEELKNMGGINEYGASGVFGHHFFRNGGIKFFQKASDATPSSAYVLGPEDKLHVEVWGYASLSSDIEIGADGYASLPMGQKLYLRGMSLGRAKELIKRRLSSLVNLQNSTVDINIIKYRTITVHIVGEVLKPGSYVIPAINTAFNALTVMGGPSNIGSVRNIYIKRGGKIIDTLDAYHYMLYPKKTREVYLQDNDYIIVDPIGKLVTINGAVKRPGLYELKRSEQLNELVRIAAGLNNNTYLEDVLVSRIRDNKYYEKIALNYDSLFKENKNFALINGDEVSFKSIIDDTYQLVDINGAVNIPGTYKLKSGSTVKDLIDQANGLLQEAFLEEAYLIRTNKDFTRSYYSFKLDDLYKGGNPITLQALDNVFVFSKKAYLEQGRLSIKGAVRGPMSLPYTQGLTIRDLVFISKGTKPESYMERGILTRTNPSTNEKQTIVFSLSEVLKNPSSKNNLLLKRNDEVEIFSKIKFREKFKVTISGEVHKPGDYDFTDNLSLKNLIMKAEGLSTSATNAKIEVVRLFELDEETKTLNPVSAEVLVFDVGDVLELKSEFDEFMLYPFDQIHIRKNPFYLEQKTVSIGGAVFYPGEYTLLSENEKLSDLIERAGGLRPYAFTGGIRFTRTEGYDKEIRVVTNLEKAIKRPHSSYNYTLRDQDIIEIPVSTELVTLSGFLKEEAEQNLSVFYKKNRRARHYLVKYAGGFEEGTHKRRTYVKYADGSFKQTKNFLFFNCYPKPKPGSEIVTVEKKPKKKRRRGGSGQGFDKLAERVSTLLGLVMMYALIHQTLQ